MKNYSKSSDFNDLDLAWTAFEVFIWFQEVVSQHSGQ